MLGENHESVVLLSSDVDLGSGINGFAVACHVDQHWPHIEIVLASGNVMPRSGDMPETATFILKPFGEHSVMQHLADTLPDGKKPEPLKRTVP